MTQPDRFFADADPEWSVARLAAQRPHVSEPRRRRPPVRLLLGVLFAAGVIGAFVAGLLTGPERQPVGRVLPAAGQGASTPEETGGPTAAATGAPSAWVLEPQVTLTAAPSPVRLTRPQVPPPQPAYQPTPLPAPQPSPLSAPTTSPTQPPNNQVGPNPPVDPTNPVDPDG